MNAKEAKVISDKRLENEEKKQSKEKYKEDQRLKKEAEKKIDEEMRSIYKRIEIEASLGNKCDSFFPTNNKYLRQMILSRLREDGYTASIDWQQYDDDGHGNDTLVIMW